MEFRSLIWMYLPRKILTAYADLTIMKNDDRVYLHKTLLPRLIKTTPQRVLNLGIHYYTSRFQAELMRAGIEVFTADPDRRKVRWGNSDRHAICGAQEIDTFFPAIDFDIVFLNGVLGYGINDAKTLECALRSISIKLKQNGILVIGWDKIMFPDPLPDIRESPYYIIDTSILGARIIARDNGLRSKCGTRDFKHYICLQKK